MKRVALLLILGFLILPSVLAINVTVESSTKSPLIVAGFNTPLEFNLAITNNRATDTFKIYNVLGFTTSPTEEFKIGKGETKNISFIINPRENFNPRGNYAFNYYIKAKNSGEIQEQLKIRIINFQDVFETGSSELDEEKNEVKIYLRNKENFEFKELAVKFSSPFFSFEEQVDIGPKETAEFSVKLDEEDFNELVAGFYTLRAELEASGEKAEIEGVIKFAEESDLISSKKKKGFFVRKTTINNSNMGNTVLVTDSKVSKNLISRLFTNFNLKPDDKEGFFFPEYRWSTELKPGEEEIIMVRTNWLYPILIIILIILGVRLLDRYAGRNLRVRKRVSFVKTKGGEFALKVKIYLQAQKYIERVSVIDRLPKFLNIHPRFGSEEPIRVDEQNKKVEWGFEKLEAGETRVLTYVSFSKLGVMGRFALPRTTVIYEKEGVVKESKSNKTFFTAEQKKGDKDEE